MIERMPAYPDAIISANVSHYYYAALALQQAGCLRRYICAIGVRGREYRLARLLPPYWQKKLQGRDISGIDPKLVKSIWVAELLQRGLPRMRLASRERADWLNNYLYDILARRWVEPCAIFHFVSSIGLYSARRAKMLGSIVVCDNRTEYPDYQFRLLAEEYNHLGLAFNPPGLLYEKKVKAEYALADYLIVPSLYAKRTFVQAGFDEKRVLVLPYGVDLSQFSVASTGSEIERHGQRSDTQNGRFRVVYTGQIVPRKGVHYLIAAFERMGVKDAELVLVGRVDETMLRYIAEATARDSRIRLMGEVPKVDLCRLYNSASVLVLPSLADSWGLVVLEAMACGVPVIVTENTGSGEAVQDGVNGFIVPIRDSDVLEEKLSYLYQHPDVRQEMGRAARRSAMDFTWERYGQRLLGVYQTIAKAGARDDSDSHAAMTATRDQG